ncbi:MAG: Flp pilus assembly protein CpaB [Hyphomicrobium sp.]
MRRDVVLALFLASTSGLFAALGAYNWMPSTITKVQIIQTEAPSIALTTVVSAKSDLVFGNAITADQLVETKWPEDNVPAGSYKTVAELFGEQQNRVVLEAIRANEPILRGKVSGPGQRATLSNMIGNGMKAVSIKINEVAGVGGFVLPGDYVDVLLIVESKDDEDRKKPKLPAYSDLLLERVRVLALDQSFDLKQEAPKLGQTATIEVTLADAQKIALASTVGTLSLVLRSNANVAGKTKLRRLLVGDLAGDNGDKTVATTFVPTNAVAPEPAKVPPSDGKDDAGGDVPHASVKINVVRAVESSEYSVVRTKP